MQGGQPMSTAPDIPSVQDIICTSQDSIAEMIRDLRDRRQLSALMKDLNKRLLDDGPAQSDLARKALGMLGFVST